MANQSRHWMPLKTMSRVMLILTATCASTQGASAQPRDAEQAKLAEDATRINSQPITIGPPIPASEFHLAEPADRTPRLVAQLGHRGPIWSVAISPDGRYGLSGSDDKTLKLWDLATGKEVRTFEGHSYWVKSVAFSPDGRFVLSGSFNQPIKLWDVTTGKEVRTFTGQSGWVYSVAFSPDGRLFVSGGYKMLKLWDVTTGKELRRFIGHSKEVEAIAFSPDGRSVLSGSADTTLKLWDVATGRELRTFEGHSDEVNSIAFSAEGRLALSGSSDKTLKLWDVATGKEIRAFAGHSKEVWSVAFAPDGRYVLSRSGDNTVKLWDVATGEEVRPFAGGSLGFSRDGRYALAIGDWSLKLWDLATGQEVRTIAGQSGWVRSVAFSGDGRAALVESDDHTRRFWDFTTGQTERRFTGHSRQDEWVDFSPDGRSALSRSGDKTILKLWDVATGNEALTFVGHSRVVTSVAFSPDSRYALTGSKDQTLRLWSMTTGKEVRRFTGHSGWIGAMAFSADGRLVVSADSKETIKLWDVATGKEVRTFTGQPGWVHFVAFSPDGRFVVSTDNDGRPTLWDVGTGHELRTFAEHSAFGFSPDGRLVLSSGDGAFKLLDVTTGREVRIFVQNSGGVLSVAFSPDGRLALSGSSDCTTRLWETFTGKELCRLLSFTDGTWAVVDPEGRYDASNGGDIEGLHWVVGNEPIALYQLKERYYDPGLLAKIMGFKKEPLRDVKAFHDVAFFPDVKVEPPAPGSTTARITLTNRGGGIGRVRLLVNGKEIVADARGPKPDPKAPSATLSVDLAGAAVIPGQPNTIRVLAWNAEGYLSNRGTEVSWTPEGTTPASPPELYAIVGGISSYGSDSLRLRYAGKDAEDMATALSVGAKRLFGAEKVHLTLLATSTSPNAVSPTKAAFREAFEKAKKARSSDILVVYLAGHGVAFRGDDGSDTYAYLTAEARSSDPAALKDSEVRRQTTITSEELTEWTKAVPALKQVMILDTCAAAAAAEKLVEKRDVTGEQIRALERLKDRTGFHVLMGSAANAVSYEASQYGQGILTYALLQGMRGAALKEQQYVDVSQLFQYAADQVPQLARNIGGIQRPQIAAPRGSSFDIGQLTSDDKTHIPLAMVRPLVLRPVLQSMDDGFDSLGLMPAVQRALAATSDVVTRGAGALVFVDAEELPGALRPSGFYSREGDQVTVTVNLVRDGKKLSTLKVKGRASKTEELGKRVAAEIAAALPTTAPSR